MKNTFVQKAACKMLVKLTPIANLTNVLLLAISPILFPKKKLLTEPVSKKKLCKTLSCKSWWNWHLNKQAKTGKDSKTVSYRVYWVFKGFRLKKEKWLFVGDFRPLLKWLAVFEAARQVAKRRLYPETKNTITKFDYFCVTFNHFYSEQYCFVVA